MARQQTMLPQCLYEVGAGEMKTQCNLLARYIILSPPLVVKYTPTPVWLEGEFRSEKETHRRPTPLYCREHAYTLCNLQAPEPASPF